MKYYKYRRKRKNLLEKSKGFSVVTWLIIINIIIFLGLFTINIKTGGGLGDTEVINYFALQPSSILQGKYLPSLILHMFTHTMPLHLFVNMFVLFSLGGLCEKIIGRKRFIWFYLISGLFAGILSVLLAGFFGTTDLGARIFGSPEIFMVGASGAIFAIAGLYVILLPKLKFMIIFLPFFSFPAYIMIPAALFVMWGASILWNWPIGNVAHFGGFLVGLVYSLYLRTKYRKKVQRLQRYFR